MIEHLDTAAGAPSTSATRTRGKLQKEDDYERNLGRLNAFGVGTMQVRLKTAASLRIRAINALEDLKAGLIPTSFGFKKQKLLT